MRSKMKLYICHLIKFTPESGKQGESYMEVVIKFKKQKNLEKQTFKLTQTVMYIGSDKPNVKTNTLIF